MNGSCRFFAMICIGTLFLCTISIQADDWPQWQGPDRNAVSKEKGLLKEWPKEGPTLVWKIKELGGGDSAPAIADGRIFLMSKRGEDEVVWALSETDSSELWVKRTGPAFQQNWPQSKEGPGCTPTIDGDLLYVLGKGGELTSLKTNDGAIVWQRNLIDDFDGRIPTWSYRESPLIDGDKLICTPGGEDATIVALNKLTGEMIWKCPIPNSSSNSEQAEGRVRSRRGSRGRADASGAAYASAIAIDFEGQRQ